MDELVFIEACRDDELADALQALAHPVRLSIVRQLANASACCNKEIVSNIGLAQSTVSQHLKVLVEVGIVAYAPDRQRSRYSLNLDRLKIIAGAFGLFNSNVCSCFDANCCRNKERET